MTIINDYLNKGFSSGWTREPWLIVLHYTASFTAKSCINALKHRGLSVHSCIERDGTNYRLVSEEHRAWHVGQSSWSGLSNLNHHSLGIEIVNFGWVDGIYQGESPYKVYSHNSKTDPEILPGDNKSYRDEKHGNSRIRIVTSQSCEKPKDHRAEWSDKYWISYPPEQIQAIAEQVWDWMKQYKILPENVIGHEHVSPGRKFDPGPAFPWSDLNKILVSKAELEMPLLLDSRFKRDSRIKAVQSHCARVGLPVGDIDGWWGKKTETAVQMIIQKYGSTYGFENLKSNPDNLMELGNCFKVIPGFDAGRR